MISLKEKKNKGPTYDEMCNSFTDISTDIDKLKSLVQDIHKIQGTLLNSARKDDNLESSMNTKMQEAKKLGNTIRPALEQHKKAMSEEEENEDTMVSRMRKTLFVAQSKRRCKIVNSGYDDEAIETMLDEGKTGVFATAILDQEKLARRQLIELQDRHDEFIKLEASIRELKQTFEAGKKQLSSAETYAKKARRKKFCLFSGLSVGGLRPRTRKK
ncbi:STX4 [Lepeophtheirus salmonis]|uniref:STX4 n=1 Tax=Lepeophtheirus salmonis TaxID=72036 RepID=A0A7R8CIF4_LEPSM|nr:STX4 [Lepeophtheirus salmonis]CAF2799609.1 STX4 [Lepeophtheirus salmonis]